MMRHDLPNLHAITRRQFLGAGSLGLGALALGELGVAAPLMDGAIDPAAARSPHFAGRAKSVIYVHLAGSPSQLELYDHKP
ncbi:MAG: sulfatase, partial [Bacteroidia bacterium]|nr:sulfatase [Bacteroidia bacterium]